MSRQIRQNKKIMADSQFGDTTYTKIFVGGLAWATQRDSMKSYFEQFGEILEAVVIVDKHTGRSKGYGFVTFKDPDSAIKACQDPYPVIDGRRTNCNLAAFGTQKNGPTTPQRGLGKFRSSSSSTMTMARPARSSLDASTYIYQPIPEYTLPYYGYTNYPQDIFTMNYYNAYGEQEFPTHYVVGSHNEFLPAYCCWYIPPRMDSRANPKTTEIPSHHVSQQYATGVTIGTAKGPGAASEQNSSA